MNKRLETLKNNDYKLVGICNKKTDNEILLDSNSNQEYYKELIESHKETINNNGISKCYICNHKIKDIYFLCCDKDIKVIGGTGCLNKFGNIKVKCKCCLEECDMTIRDFEINIMKDKKIDNFDYICDKCNVNDYKDIKYNEYEKLDKNYYNEWIFREIDNLDKKDYSWCNKCNYIYKSNKNDCGLCKCCFNSLVGNYDNNICSKYKYDYSNKRNKRLIRNKNYYGNCFCKNCCFKDTKLNKLLENNEVRMKIRDKERYIVGNTYDNLMINNVNKYMLEILCLIKSNDYSEIDNELNSIYGRVMIDSINNVKEYNNK